MRIGIDARFYGPIGKGLGRYTQKLIENLEKIDHDNCYFIFLRRQNFDDYQPSNPNFKKVLADYRWYTFSEQIKFPYLLRKFKLDLVHFPHFNVPLFYFGKFAVTIHDLILIHFPTVRNTTLNPLIYWLKFLGYKIVIKSAILRSNRIFSVSEFTKKDILKHYGRIPKEKIIVTYEACDDYCLFNPRRMDEIISRYGIIKPYILYVGNAYPHKNPERLCLAIKKLAPKIDLNLVFVGGEDYFYERLKEFAEKSNIRNVSFPGFIPDYDMDSVFRAAAAYIRPSLYEGFELPPLEAMTRGIPVICSDHTCAKEILGDAALYFDAEDTDDMARAIEKVYRDKNLRDILTEKGYQLVKKYSWKRMARETLAAYGSIQV